MRSRSIGFTLLVAALTVAGGARLCAGTAANEKPAQVVHAQSLDITCPSGWTPTLRHHPDGNTPYDTVTLDGPQTAIVHFAIHGVRIATPLKEHADTIARQRRLESKDVVMGPSVSSDGPLLRFAGVQVATIVQQYDAEASGLRFSRTAMFVKLERPSQTVFVMMTAPADAWRATLVTFRSILESSRIH